MAILSSKNIVVTIAGALFGALLGLTCFFMFQPNLEEIKQNEISKQTEARLQIKNLMQFDFEKNTFPLSKELLWNNELVKANINYTLDSNLQNSAEKLLQAYKPDYGAIVAIEPSTGKIKAMASYVKGIVAGENLVLRNTYPAASVFKIVTATAALKSSQFQPESLIPFNGANHTLYKSNVLGNKTNRWTRKMSLREAFAKSVNVVFGRIGLFHVGPTQLLETAESFGFNQHFPSDLPIDTSLASIPNIEDFHLAEIASGFNKITTLSPIHGAMIAGSITQKGAMKIPYVIESIKLDNGEEIYRGEPSLSATNTMTPEVAHELKEMMEATIFEGTSKKAFRPLVKNKSFRELKLGGKTGSLTGDNPKGKTDWFVGYAMNDENEALAIAALTVNVKYWTVKSSHLAQALFATKFKELTVAKNDREPAEIKTKKQKNH